MLVALSVFLVLAIIRYGEVVARRREESRRFVTAVSGAVTTPRPYRKLGGPPL